MCLKLMDSPFIPFHEAEAARQSVRARNSFAPGNPFNGTLYPNDWIALKTWVRMERRSHPWRLGPKVHLRVMDQKV